MVRGEPENLKEYCIYIKEIENKKRIKRIAMEIIFLTKIVLHLQICLTPRSLIPVSETGFNNDTLLFSFGLRKL